MTAILVVRLGSLGDLIHTLPAVAALRRAHLEADIDWLVDAPHRRLLELVPVISNIIVLRDRTARAWLEARARLRGRRYDVALDFQGLLKSAALARLSGAARVLGFDRDALRERTATPFYTEQIAVGEGQHVIQKNLRLAAAVGARTDALAFPIGPVASAVADDLAAAGPFALLNVGAAWPNKRWPPDRFAALAERIAGRHGLRSVVLWGPGEEAHARAAAQASGGAATVAPATTFDDLIALARRARLMVSGDTGPTHIAAAVGTPVVAIFGPTNPRRNGPWSADDIALARYEQCDCHYERVCRRSDADWCLQSVTVDEVGAAVDARLERPDAR